MKLFDKTWKISLFTALFPAIINTIIIGFSLNQFAEYGLGIFILSPFFIGLVSSSLKSHYSIEKVSFKDCHKTMVLSLFFLMIALIICAIEGLMCIIMAAPLGYLVALVGTLIGYVVFNNKPNKTLLLIFLASNLFLLPSFIALEKNTEKELIIYPVKTSVIIKASKQEVWNHLVEFSEIEAPTEFMFKNGISYPINSEVKGHGVGAIRYCNFSTGSFVEPVDIWNEPDLLHFVVKEQPIPMKEFSPYDIHPKHLHGYFVSVKGQFKLNDLGNGQTQLEGTTWYYNKIHPQIYWKQWTDLIIHTIHERVLKHIKTETEEAKKMNLS